MTDIIDVHKCGVCPFLESDELTGASVPDRACVRHRCEHPTNRHTGDVEPWRGETPRRPPDGCPLRQRPVLVRLVHRD